MFTKARGELLDPHTATGIHAARMCQEEPDVATVVLATAHPAKFPDAVKKATGVEPALPPHMADLFSLEERLDVLENDDAGRKSLYLRRRFSRRPTLMAGLHPLQWIPLKKQLLLCS